MSGEATAITAWSALPEANYGNLGEARRQARAALAISRSIDALEMAAVVLARTGAVGEAQALIDELGERYPTHTLVNGFWVPTARAAIAIHRGEPASAIEVLQAAIPYERGTGTDAAFLPTYVRGLAYLESGSAKEATAEFRKILDAPGGLAPLRFVYPLAHLGLARAYALAGDTTQSRCAYEDFFSLWKNADPDIAILLEAKSEYAKLQEVAAGVPTN